MFGLCLFQKHVVMISWIEHDKRSPKYVCRRWQRNRWIRWNRCIYVYIETDSIQIILHSIKLFWQKISRFSYMFKCVKTVLLKPVELCCVFFDISYTKRAITHWNSSEPFTTMLPYLWTQHYSVITWWWSIFFFSEQI